MSDELSRGQNMLQHLRIEGLAIIETLEIEFNRGFNVITGETGAGKSILIKALGLLFGAKSGPESVRKGKESAVIAAEFELPTSHPAIAKIQLLGIALEDVGEAAAPAARILIRRRIHQRGRSQAWINDEAVTSATLRDIGSELIDIFAQHENQRLLDQSQHLSYVDAFVKDQAIIERYRTSYEEIEQLYTQLADRVDSLINGTRDQDYLQYRLGELDQFAPTEDDYQSIKDQCDRLRVKELYRESFLRAQELVDSSVDGDSLNRPLRELQRLLTQMQKRGSLALVGDLVEKVERLILGIDELSYEISASLQGTEEEGVDLESLESRVADYQALIRKFSVQNVAELVAQHDQLRVTLEGLANAKGEIDLLLAELLNRCQKITKISAQLTEARENAAADIQKTVQSELADLAMPSAKLEVRFDPVLRQPRSVQIDRFGADAFAVYQQVTNVLAMHNKFGTESAEFCFSANRGEQSYPIQRIASGGEVSRIMLAFKRALTFGADSCLLVFDEIDAGISGKTANMVGAKLSDLAKRFQVLCISHLAQVTAYADTHFVVRKSEVDGRTESSIVALTKKQSIEELARLLSGDEITKQSLANAKTLRNKVARFRFEPANAD